MSDYCDLPLETSQLSLIGFLRTTRLSVQYSTLGWPVDTVVTQQQVSMQRLFSEFPSCSQAWPHLFSKDQRLQ